MSNDEEYLAVTARIADLEEKLKSFDDVPGKKQELRMQISTVMKQISNVDADIKIAQAAVTEKEKRVAELNEELKNLDKFKLILKRTLIPFLTSQSRRIRHWQRKSIHFSIISSSVSLITRLREIQWKLAR